MKTINTAQGIKGLALLGLGLGLAVPVSVWAQPDPNNAGKAQNPANRAGRARGARGANGQGAVAKARMEARELAVAEAIAGKPLTDEQKQKVREALAAREEAVSEAREKYIAEMAASLGVEPGAVRFQMRGANARRNMAGGQGEGQGRRGGRRNRVRQGGQGAAAPAAGG